MAEQGVFTDTDMRARQAKSADFIEAADYARKCMARPEGVSEADWYKCRCAIEAVMR